jgi:glucose/arabinose dehydrogenase
MTSFNRGAARAVQAAAVALAAVAMQAGAAHAQPALGTHRISKEMPAPSDPKPNPPKMAPKPADVELTLPPGFQIATFAEGFKRPRWAVEAPNGDIFVSDSTVGNITVLHDADRNQAIAETERSEYATGLNQPFGMAFWKGGFYVANTDAILRFPYRNGDRKASGPSTKIADLPSGKTGHWTRNIAFSRDGRWLYAGVGSSSNVDPDPDPLRATILRFKPDGSGREVVSTGVRNPVGLGFHPKTQQLWMAVQERDGLGDELVPDYVARVRQGAFFGWPYAYIGANEEPRRKGERPDLVKTAVVPDVLVQSHSSILGLTFYGAKQFPAKYRNGAFAALRGSSNRTKRTGYKVIFLPFDSKGDPTGEYEDFVVGWMLGEDKPEVWGRPVGLAVLKDGSMLITDDGANKIWRVTYTEK